MGLAVRPLGLKSSTTLPGSPVVAGYFIGSGKQEVVHSSHIPARHADSGMTEERLDG